MVCSKTAHAFYDLIKSRKNSICEQAIKIGARLISVLVQPQYHKGLIKVGTCTPNMLHRAK